MNFEGFKKVASDDHVTTLMHPKGHMIKVVHGALSQAMRKKVEDIPHYADGGEVEDDNQGSVMSDAPTLQDVQQATPATGEISDVIHETPDPSFYDMESKQAPPEIGGMAQGQFPAMPAPASVGMGGLGKIKSGLRAEADALGQQGRMQASALGKVSQSLGAEDSKYQQQRVDYIKERNDLQEDIKNSHVDPNHYWGNLSTPGKFASAIGLILGGIGGGLTHQENPALKAIQKNIEDDIESQKLNIGKKQSLLEANLKTLGNLDDAHRMTRVQMMDMATLEMKKIATQTADPIAKARLLTQVGQIEAQSQAQMQPLIQKQQVMDAVRSGQMPPEAILNFLPPADQAKAREEIDKATDAQSKLQATMQAFDTVAKAKTVGNTIAHPLRAISGAQAEQLNGAIAELNKSLTGRFNTEENKKLFAQFAPSRLDTPEDVALKRTNLMKYAALGMGNFTTLKKHGIDPSMFSSGSQMQSAPPQERVFIDWAKKNPNNPKAQMVLRKNGLM